MGMALHSAQPLVSPPPRHLTAVPRPGRHGRPSRRGRQEGFGPASPGASVRVLHPPIDSGPAAPLRLTRRGVVVVSVAVALAGAALVWLAAVSAPRASSGSAHPVFPRFVTVRPGDTLWAIATRLAPDADPGAEVAVLQRANHLSGVLLQPGERLRTG